MSVHYDNQLGGTGGGGGGLRSVSQGDRVDSASCSFLYLPPDCKASFDRGLDEVRTSHTSPNPNSLSHPALTLTPLSCPTPAITLP